MGRGSTAIGRMGPALGGELCMKDEILVWSLSSWKGPFLGSRGLLIVCRRKSGRCLTRIVDEAETECVHVRMKVWLWVLVHEDEKKIPTLR